MADSPSQPPAADIAAEAKRKRYAPDLEVLTLDPHYDLTIIVGTPKHKDGQKAFRVNKGSMRHVSDVWTKMLTGDWAESNMTEIDFPDDSWKSFHIVLKIAHLQPDELPDSLTVESLCDLATLTDKYNLIKAVRMGLDLKSWLHQHMAFWTAWPSLPSTQQFAVMASVFKYDSDRSFLISKLAVEIEVDANENVFYRGRGAEVIQLSSDLPDHVKGE